MTVGTTHKTIPVTVRNLSNGRTLYWDAANQAEANSIVSLVSQQSNGQHVVVKVG